MINQIFSKNALTYVFIVIVFVSFLIHLNFRQSHFQELDSSGVYYVLNNFPTSAMNFISMSYMSENLKIFKTREAAENFFNKEIVDKNLRAVLGAKYNDKNKELIISEIYQGKSIFFYLRAAEILALNKIVHLLPIPLFTTIVQPLSSTYSPGPGFFYGFMGAHSSYDDFMKFAGTFQLLIFHLGVLIMFFTVSFLSKNRFTALTVGSLMLFSYSLYSYAHHMGSVTWNIFVPTIFIGLLLYYYNKEREDILRRVSIISSWLLLFSYGLLISFYLSETFTYLSLIEFWVFFPLFVSGLYVGYKKIKGSEKKLIWYFIVSLLALYSVSVVFNILSFIPSRHILFLTPVLFIIISFAIDVLYKRLDMVLLVLFNVLLISAGFYSVIASQDVTFDQTLHAKVPTYIDSVIVYGENYPLKYRFEDSHHAFIKKGNVLLSEQIKPNVRYLYVSQLGCFEDLLQDAKDEGIHVVLENKKQYVTDQKFIAFDPSDFVFNSPNNYCQAEFIWKE